MAISELEAQALVRAHQAGDERAFEQIVRTQYQALYAHAYKRLSNHESAEDAVQDTLLRAYRALPNLDGDLRLQAWLHRILTNVCHDEGNRRMRQAGLIDRIGSQPEELAPDPAEEVAVFDSVRLMAEALDQLPESYREALVLRYVDGLSFREVAEATGVSEENARARVHRGRLALRTILSRVALILAFLVPGLKKAHAARATADAATALPSEPAISLTTQLTSHVVQAAPAMSRVAEMASAFPGGKSALVTTAVAAVAAVSVPVAATVHDVTKPNDRPAAVAQARPSTTLRYEITSPPNAGAADVVANEEIAATTTTSTSTSTTLPPSQAHAFETVPSATVPGDKPSSSSTTSSTSSTTSSTTTSTTVLTGPVIEGATKSDDLTATKTGPQYDLAGSIVLATPNGTKAGQLDGRLGLLDDGTVVADGFAISMADGKSLELRFRGTWTSVLGSDGSTSYKISGQFALGGAAAYGLPESGSIAATFRYSDKGTASLASDLKGRAKS